MMKLVALLIAAAVPLAQANPTTDEESCTSSDPAMDYNLNLAIVSVFVLLVVSFIGAGFPALLALRRHPWLVLGIKLGSFAGSGVLLATGFVHMLTSANENLSNSCLPEGWLERYPSWAFMFTVITIVFLQVLDYFLSILLEPVQLDISSTSKDSIVTVVEPVESQLANRTTDADPEAGECHKHSRCKDEECNGRSLLPPASPSTIECDDSPKAETAECNQHPRCKDDQCNGRTLLPLPSPGKAKAISTLVVSEISIGIHSILIGIALGVTSSTSFTALFIAIVFHQFLEGIALGSNAVESGISTRMVVILAFVYSLTTPVGIAVGIAVRSSLNMNSVPSLMVTGILDSIAAGALIFLALGDHMNACKSQAGWLRTQRIVTQLACFAAFFIGAAALLVIAIWA